MLFLPGQYTVRCRDHERGVAVVSDATPIPLLLAVLARSIEQLNVALCSIIWNGSSFSMSANNSRYTARSARYVPYEARSGVASSGWRQALFLWPSIRTVLPTVRLTMSRPGDTAVAPVG